MYSAAQLSLRLALLQAPDDVPQPLSGVFVRELNMNWTPMRNNAIAADSWQRYEAPSERSMSLRIEGVLSNAQAVQYLRKAGCEGVPLQLEITWPGKAVSEGNFYIRNYQEYGEPDSVLEYRAELISANAQTFTALL